MDSGAPTSGTDPLLAMRDVRKRFAGTLALDGASLDVAPGEVMALVGQNGAGKSTMIKILNGAHRADSGEVRFKGRRVDFASPHAAQAGGVSTIFQEINLIPLRSVAENVFLGREPKRFGLIDWGRLNREAAAILEGFGLDLDVRRPLGTYGIAVQQMVAIARAVSFDARLVIMDEPTSSLDSGEVRTLFASIRRLRERGVAVLFVSHRLDELYAICDRVTVMRDGRTVAVAPMAAMTKLDLIAAMLGRELNPGRGQTGFVGESHAGGAMLLRAEGLRAGPRVRDVALDVRTGEITGLAGLLGSGRSETARALFGAERIEAGLVRYDGAPIRFHEPAAAIKAGLGYAAEDRKADGTVPDLSVRDNLTLALMPRLAKAGVIDEAAQRAIVGRFIDRLKIKTAGPDQPIRELSGGNQQKVLLARWLCMNPRLLILDEPTRGIDVGAKAEIQRLIGDLAADGLAVLMITSELEELIEGCDSVVVLADGVSVRELGRDDLSDDSLMAAMAHDAVPAGAHDAVPAIARDAASEAARG